MRKISEALRYTEEDRKAILKEFDRTPESVKVDIESLKLWLDQQPHLPKNILNSHQIEMFLVLNKFSIEKTKSKIDMYFTIRHLIPEMYTNTLPTNPKMIEMMKCVYVLPLSGLKKNFYRPSICVVMDPVNLDGDPVFFFAYVLNLFEIKMQHDFMMGETLIYDMKNVKLGHFTKATPVILKKVFSIFQKVYADRCDGLHYINCSPQFDFFLNMMKTCLTKKMSDRLFIHRKIETLYEYVPQELLPKEYGGKDRSIHELQRDWLRFMEEHDSWYNTINSVVVDESLRPGKPINDEILGFHGNFRKLDVD